MGSLPYLVHFKPYTCIRIQNVSPARTGIYTLNNGLNMKYYLIIMISVALCSCSISKKQVSSSQKMEVVTESAQQLDRLSPGISAYGATAIDYNRSGKSVMTIILKEPVVISVASKPEKWGFFQFPVIARNPDNTISARWNLNADAMEAYGEHKFGGAISRDEGLSWALTQDATSKGILVLSNGDRIAIHTPKPIKVEELQLPNTIGAGMDTYSQSPKAFYKLHDLPESRQGVFIDRLAKGETEWKTEKASLIDPEAARYSLRGQIPIVWWGDMRQLKDGSIIAGIYPGFIIRSDGVVDPKSGVFFYKSADNGRSWKIHGRITYIPDLAADSNGNKRMGFTEPAFEILHDGTFICIIRTTDGIGNGPMYICRSSDQGVTWTKPELVTPSGVLPRLLQLKNGIAALAAGRPGVQLRFTSDGKHWTDPLEMMPYENYKDQVSCGYSGLLETGPDRFLLIYSDFKFLNEAKEPRKAIKVREVIVTPK